MNVKFSSTAGLGGILNPPADKSITHRTLMLAAVSEGTSWVYNPLETGDCLSTRDCLGALGVSMELKSKRRGKPQTPALKIGGVGLCGLEEARRCLSAGNSGSTVRLLSGLLAGQNLYAVFDGDTSLGARPMLRIVEPLRAMGAAIHGRQGGRYLPLTFLPGQGWLEPIDYSLTVPSAQVKTALLFAAMRAPGVTTLRGRTDSRDHTERLFRYLGLPLEESGGELHLEAVQRVPPFEITVPGDPSSAAFFAAAAVISGQDLRIRHCGLNPSRLGFYEALRRMGARVELQVDGESGPELSGDLLVECCSLHGIQVQEEEIPSLIDEIPLLAVLGAFAEGVTTVRGARELRVKESDRIQATVELITALGGTITELDDGFSIEGPQRLSGGTISSKNDHRIAMAGAVASAGCSDAVEVLGFEAAAVSYPDFIRDFQSLGGTAE